MRTLGVVACVAFLSGLALSACGGQPPPEPAAPPAPPADLPPAAVETQTLPAAAAATPPAEPAPEPRTPVARITQGISTPESVLYDEAGDRYLVSNINGKPMDADNNGYITDVSPQGTVTNEKLVAGGVNNVKLSAPKGMGIVKGVLYVTDITVVRKFDAKTGAPRGEIAFPGAGFLNDIAVGPDGRIYVSDSDPSTVGAPSAGTDAVYVIEKDKPRVIAKSTELGGPNGLVFTDKGLFVNTNRSNELYRLDDKGVRHDITKLPNGGLDGLVALGDSFLVSSWKGSAVYRGSLNGQFQVALGGLSGAADIGFDTRRQRVLVPRFMDNAVEIYALP